MGAITSSSHLSLGLAPELAAVVWSASASANDRKRIPGFSRWSQHLIDPVRVLMTMRFSNQLVAELYQPFWAAWQ
ncbi:MAG: hypothetical protein ACRDYB_16920, partial [Acidimicrobiales bacterium]